LLQCLPGKATALDSLGLRTSLSNLQQIRIYQLCSPLYLNFAFLADCPSSDYDCHTVTRLKLPSCHFRHVTLSWSLQPCSSHLPNGDGSHLVGHQGEHLCCFVHGDSLDPRRCYLALHVVALEIKAKHE
jgi:hypothetical protein